MATAPGLPTLTPVHEEVGVVGKNRRRGRKPADRVRVQSVPIAAVPPCVAARESRKQKVGLWMGVREGVGSEGLSCAAPIGPRHRLHHQGRAATLAIDGQAAHWDWASGGQLVQIAAQLAHACISEYARGDAPYGVHGKEGESSRKGGPWQSETRRERPPIGRR